MATMQLFGKFSANVLGGEAAADAGVSDYLSNDIRVTLHTNTWVPNTDTNEAFADATNELAGGNGYTANGQALGTKTAVYATDRTTFDCADFSWTASGGSIGPFRYAVIFDNSVTVGPPIKPLYGFIDVGAGSMTITDGNTVTFQTGANGLFQGIVTGA
jgi:hypothetical protein